MIHTNCFAFCPKRCKILTEQICKDKECSFFKTQEQIKADFVKYPPIDYPLYKETGQKVYLKRGRVRL